MADYRFHVSGSDRHFECSRDFVCDTDENAVVWAKQMAGQQAWELWSGKRMVERSEKQAVSYQVLEGRLVPKDKW
jgi:hypothetical protein